MCQPQHYFPFFVMVWRWRYFLWEGRAFLPLQQNLFMKIIKLMQARQTEKRIRSLNTEPSGALTEIRYLNRILIPCKTEADEPPSQHSLAFKHKTNPKQLYEFIKNQLIVVKQKEKLISNHSQLVRFRGKSEADEKLSREICLKGEKEEGRFVNNGQLRTICLPRVDSELHSKEAKPPARRKRQNIKLPSNPRRLNNLSSRKRLSSLASRNFDLEHTPLVHSASKSLSRQASAKREAKTSISHSPSEVVNFSLYQQQPRLSKLSLNLMVQVARAHRQSLSGMQ